jgi:hypothetical protein
MGAEPSFDLDAAALRADGRDLDAGVEVLASKLEGALPGATRVERRAARLLSRERHVAEIEVRLGESTYLLHRERHGVTTTRAKTVRGVRIRNEDLDVEAWLAALEADLREQAQTSAEARAALERLLR